METEITPPQSVAPPPKGRSRLLLWSGAVVLVIFFILAAILLSHSREDKLTWLDPTALTRPALPKALVQLKYKVLQLTAPIWSRFRRNRPLIMTDANIFTMTAATANKLSLDAATATNTDGLRAWILSPEKIARFNHLIANQPGISIANRPRIQSGDGQQAQLGMTQTMPRSSVPAAQRSFTNLISVGLTIDLIAKLKAGGISVSVVFTNTETNGWSPDGQLIIKTNLDMGCRALVPNGGGLIIEGGRGTNEIMTNYWFAISSTAIGPDGIPIKLP